MSHDWREKAACRGVDAELFFPIGHSGPAQLQADRAKAVCRRCPVADKCLQWALDIGEDHGVWGGLDEVQRRRLKRTGTPGRGKGGRRIAPCGTASAYKRHQANQEPIDEACRAAIRESDRHRRERRRQDEPQPCGTPSAYRRHLAHGEECETCETAQLAVSGG